MRLIRSLAVFSLMTATLAGCGERETGPVRAVAIGPPPAMADPNREPIAPATALLLDTVAQGLVRFDAAGDIEPALAQSWYVSDDGRRYTFRIRRTTWADGEEVTARQVVERLQAVLRRNSRNPLRQTFESVERIEAMTDRVLEIRLLAPRPNFLQLLAHPEMAIVREGQGTGPFQIEEQIPTGLRLVPPQPEDEEETQPEPPPDIILSGTSAARAVALFRNRMVDFVGGGTLGDLPVLSAAELPSDQVMIDPTNGLFGLAFLRAEGPLADASLRRALSMSIDRQGIAARFGTASLQMRASIVPPGVDELPAPAQPDWAGVPLDQRRGRAAAIVDEIAGAAPLRLRVGVPDGTGYRIIFAHLRRDWRAIGVEAVSVPAGAPAELRLVDMVAPAEIASWYLRPFMCGQSAVCDQSATQALEAARAAPLAERQALLAQADAALTEASVFIPIASPFRWSLVSDRLNGFRVNPFAQHALTELIARRN